MLACDVSPVAMFYIVNRFNKYGVIGRRKKLSKRPERNFIAFNGFHSDIEKGRMENCGKFYSTQMPASHFFWASLNFARGPETSFLWL